MTDRMPPQDELRQLVDYDPDTGLITWKPRGIPGWDKRWAGKRAFCCKSRGYLVGVLFGVRSIGAHRVAYKFVHGIEPPEVDHINGIRTDNRIANLRAVSSLENKRNAAKPCTNKSGVVGVHFRTDKRKWVAHISIDNRYKYLGYFATKQEAVERRKAAEREFGFHPNHGRNQCL